MNCGMSACGGVVLESERGSRALNRHSFVGRETRFRFVEKTVASASALVRGSTSCVSVGLMVKGRSGSLLLQKPSEKKPVTCVRCAIFAKPPALNVFAEFDG